MGETSGHSNPCAVRGGLKQFGNQIRDVLTDDEALEAPECCFNVGEKMRVVKWGKWAVPRQCSQACTPS